MKAIILIMKTLAVIINDHFTNYDRETSAVLVAMVDFIQKHGKEG